MMASGRLLRFSVAAMLLSLARPVRTLASAPRVARLGGLSNPLQRTLPVCGGSRVARICMEAAAEKKKPGKKAKPPAEPEPELSIDDLMARRLEKAEGMRCRQEVRAACAAERGLWRRTWLA